MSNTENATPEPDDGDAPTSRSSRRRRGLAIGSSLALVLVAGIGFMVWRQVEPLVTAKYRSVTYTVPTAPQLTPAAGQKVYRVDPTHSALTYKISEHLIGAATSHATGVTNGIAGDILIDPTTPSNSKVGTIVVNLEQLHSDNNLRDARIRQDFLESHDHPLATFHVTSIKGLPATLVEGKSYPLTLVGTATVHNKTAPVTWQATASVNNGKLTVKATTHIKLSTFGIGPITLQGLVSTGDDVALTLNLTALDPSQYAIPKTITGPHAKTIAGGPSFKAAVAPILEQNCASCHNSGQVGSLHWVLDTAGDAASVSEGIKTTTQARYMPPWPASDKGVPLSHPMTLSAADLSTLASWADHGGKLDEPATTPIKPSKQVQEAAPRKDEVLMMPKAYTGVASIPNDYRCFVLNPKITKPTFLTGYTFLPDQLTEIHHSQVFHISAAAGGERRQARGPGRPARVAVLRRRRRSRRVAVVERHPAQDAGRGLLGPEQPRGRLGPGPAARRSTPTTAASCSCRATSWSCSCTTTTTTTSRPTARGWPCSSRRRPGRTSRSCASSTRWLRSRSPATRPTPVRCATATAAIKDDVRLYGPQGAFIENGLMLLCGQTPAKLTADFNGTVAHSSCNLQVPMSGTLVAVMGHMHTLGKTLPAHPRSGHPAVEDPARHPELELRLADELRPADPAARHGRRARPHAVLVGPLARPHPQPQVHRVRRGHRGRDVLRHLRPHPRRPELQRRAAHVEQLPHGSAPQARLNPPHDPACSGDGYRAPCRRIPSPEPSAGAARVATG